jgi:hypothetical protein
MVQGRQAECLLAYRTRGEYWGKERAAIVTYNPSSHRKQQYSFNNKLEAIRQELLSMRAAACIISQMLTSTSLKFCSIGSSTLLTLKICFCARPKGWTAILLFSEA